MAEKKGKKTARNADLEERSTGTRRWKETGCSRSTLTLVSIIRTQRSPKTRAEKNKGKKKGVKDESGERKRRMDAFTETGQTIMIQAR